MVPVPDIIELESQPSPAQPEPWKQYGLVGPPGPGQALKGPLSRDLVPKPKAKASPKVPPVKRGHQFKLVLSQEQLVPAAAPSEPASPAVPAVATSSPREASPSAPFKPPAVVAPQSSRSSLLPTATPFSLAKPPAPPSSPSSPAEWPTVPKQPPKAKAKAPAKPAAVAKPAQAQQDLQQRLQRHHDPKKKSCREGGGSDRDRGWRVGWCAFANGRELDGHPACVWTGMGSPSVGWGWLGWFPNGSAPNPTDDERRVRWQVPVAPLYVTAVSLSTSPIPALSRRGPDSFFGGYCLSHLSAQDCD